MSNRKYKKRSPGDIVNGAVLIERINSRLWKMQCKCGEYFVSQPSCTSGKCRECGIKDSAKSRKKHGESPKHGKNATRLYEIWTGMKNRCSNPNNHSYNFYGGRGIKVCEQWNEYLNFKTWAIENGYSDNLSLDRIDVNGNYCPENCRWATIKEQMRNTRANHKIKFNGKEKTMAEWAEEIGMNYHTLKHRINKYGFSVEEALTIPVFKRGYMRN